MRGILITSRGSRKALRFERSAAVWSWFHSWFRSFKLKHCNFEGLIRLHILAVCRYRGAFRNVDNLGNTRQTADVPFSRGNWWTHRDDIWTFWFYCVNHKQVKQKAKYRGLFLECFLEHLLVEFQLSFFWKLLLSCRWVVLELPLSSLDNLRWRGSLSRDANYWSTCWGHSIRGSSRPLLPAHFRTSEVQR